MCRCDNFVEPGVAWNFRSLSFADLGNLSYLNCPSSKSNIKSFGVRDAHAQDAVGLFSSEWLQALSLDCGHMFPSVFVLCVESQLLG